MTGDPVGILQTAFRNSRDALALKDAQFVYRAVNPAFCALVGRSESELLGKSDLDIFPAEQAEELRAEDARAVQRSVLRLQVQEVTTAAGKRLLRVTRMVMLGAGGSVEAVLWMAQEVTGPVDDRGLSEADAQIKRHLAFTEALLSAIPTPVFYKDAEGRYLGCNRAFTDIMGVATEDIRGRTVQECWPSDHAQVYHDKDLELMRNEAQQVYEFVVRDKGGQTREVIYAKNVFRDEKGAVAGLVGAFMDISDRKRTEAALREANDRFSHILEAVDAIVWEGYPGAHTFTFVSKSAERILGYPAEQWTNEPSFWASVIHPDDREWVTLYCDEKSRRGESHDLEFRLVAANGKIIWVRDIVTVICEEDHPVRSLGVIVDVTERKRVEAAVREGEERLRQAHKLEALGRLAGGVAHDLNNLLTPILGCADMLMLDTPPDAPSRQSLQYIAEAGQRARDLVRQLLAFARRQVLDVVHLDLNRVLTGLCELLRRTLRENISIELQLGNVRRTVRGDVRQLEQVIINLALNGQDAMPDGGTLVLRTLEVDLESKPWVMLSVSDTGSGMGPETVERAFEPFFTTKQQATGTGLGLAMVHGIVQQHGGQISVDSFPGRGTTLTICLPASDTAAEAQAAPPARVVAGTARVLVAEDDAVVREVTCGMLRSLGYDVVSAQTSEGCLHVAQQLAGTIDLLLTDVIMPVLNGPQLYELVKKSSPTVKVLFMSGYSGDIVANHGALPRGVHLLEKPFTRQELSKMIEGALRD